MRSTCFWKIHDHMELRQKPELPDNNRMANFWTSRSTLLCVPDRKIQGHDRLRMVHVLSAEHVLGCSERHVDCHVRGLSGELHVAARERIEKLLPVQRGLYTRR
jgi:hypothetical protein